MTDPRALETALAAALGLTAPQARQLAALLPALAPALCDLLREEYGDLHLARRDGKTQPPVLTRTQAYRLARAGD